MNRFNWKEFTSNRLRDALDRRIKDFPHFIAWSFLHFGIASKERLRKFKNTHTGERCFILGNGPSLQCTDLTLLKNEISFGLNRIYLLFDKVAYKPTYYVCINNLVLEQFSTEIQQLNMPKFLNWNSRNYFEFNDPNTYFIKSRFGISDRFSKDPTSALSDGGTVTYVALQLAFYMGFKNVILIGVDHNFQDQGIPNSTEIRRSEVDSNHFHPNYFPKGIKWQLPDLQRSELAYSLARRTYEADKRTIWDATINGKCNIFPKIDYYSLFT